MPRLAIAKTFLTRYANLEKKVRKSVDKAIAQFEAHTYAGLHLEKLEAAKDPRVRTIRVDQFWRGVVLAPETGDVYCLITVLPHDDAIKYARSRKFGVNQALGVLEVRNAEALEQIAPALESMAKTAPDRLFERVADADLVRLGIDPDVLPIVRLLVNDDHLTALETLLPEPQYLALVALASGMSVEAAWDEICRLVPPDAPPADPDDLVTAMERSPDQVVFVSGPEDLANVLEHPFALWRVFLHPDQRRIALRPSYSGPVQVTGGAGTGKTVTAVHRSHLLARRGAGTVLLTTFTKTLAEALSHQLDLLIDDPEERRRVEVTHVDRLAYGVAAKGLGRSPRVVGQAELQAFWGTAATDSDFSPAFLQREWEQVILAQDIHDQGTYLSCTRAGRGKPLNRAQRERAWRAISRFRSQLDRAGYWTHPQIAAEAARICAAEPVRPYQHIVVDEAQDLSPAHWRLLRALVPECPDDLFVVGDPHQRIYDNRVSLGSLGINVRGRSHRLKLSYRTTQEILTWSVRLLGAEPVTGLDDAPDDLAGYYSSLHGRRPVVRACASRDEELDALAEQVRTWIDAGVEPGAIGVAARQGQLASTAQKALRAAGIATIALATSTSADNAVRVGTMHRMKGLEFRCVAVVGVAEDIVPAQNAVTPVAEDPIAHEQDVQRERCVLFVACTRARDSLYVSHAGTPSPFLP